MVEDEYIETCRKCGTLLDMVKAIGDEEIWRCPKCDYEERHLGRSVIPKSTDTLMVLVLWKSGTRRATEAELVALRELDPAFAPFTVQQLATRFEGQDRVELGVFPKDAAAALMNRARELDLWPSFEIA